VCDRIPEAEGIKAQAIAQAVETYKAAVSQADAAYYATVQQADATYTAAETAAWADTVYVRCPIFNLAEKILTINRYILNQKLRLAISDERTRKMINPGVKTDIVEMEGMAAVVAMTRMIGAQGPVD
jgi:hypothetical protein